MNDGATLVDGLLAGRRVVLTGAAGGIGRILAEVLRAAGADSILLDRPGDLLDDLGASLSDDHTLVEAVDVTDRAAVAATRDRVVSERGPIDGLVNCAGLWRPAPFAEVDATAWDDTVAANLESAFVCCQALLPGMLERRSGSIVNFASTAGEYGSISPAAHYAAAKGGIIALTKSLAREAGPGNVRVNAVSPGPTDTPALGAASPEQKAAVGARTLLGRLGQPHEIAHGALFLLSPLSTFVTGHVLRVNGGSLL